MKVESRPAGAMVSVASTGSPLIAVAGITPLERTFTFPKRGGLILTLEKRGCAPSQIEIQPGSGTVREELERLVLSDGTVIPDYSLPRAGVVVVVPPEIEVIMRRFSREGVDPEASLKASASLRRAVSHALESRFEVREADLTDDTREPLKALWRDGRTALQLIDPIRLPYLAQPPRLETGSSRKAAALFGRGEPQTYLFLLDGKQVKDTAGMKLGQLAVLSIGTAASYGSGYARAMEQGDSLFAYSIHTPDFAAGLTLKAVLIDSATGELLWLNRGIWSAVRFDEKAEVEEVVGELLTGLL